MQLRDNNIYKILKFLFEKQKVEYMKSNDYLNFLKKYDAKGDLSFSTINYRVGASITGKFGLDEGFRQEGDKLVWGYARIHTGVDRANGGQYKGWLDPVVAPFDFESSRFEDYDGAIYGTLVVLVSEKYGFEFRIAHMDQNDIFILEKLKDKFPIQQNTLIGKAGNYGLSGGKHTHTEIKSLIEQSNLLEFILKEKFGEEADKEYTIPEVITYYKGLDKFKNESDTVILKDWERLKEERRCLFINRFKYKFTDFDGKIKTRYGSLTLFNGL